MSRSTRRGPDRAIRAVLFDKDGTLLDYARTWTPINREVAAMSARGDEALADQLLRIGGQNPTSDAITPGSLLAAGTHEEVAALFAAHLDAERTPPDLANEIARIFVEGGGRHSVLVDDTRATLEGLHALGLILGVATNDTAAGLQASLGRHPGVIERFAFLAGCDSGHGAKPGPGMVHAFARSVGCAPAEIAVVGDAEHDMMMGRSAGAGLNIGILGGTSASADLSPHADHIVARLADVIPLVVGHFPTKLDH